MPNEDPNAVNSADRLLRHLIQHQPQMVILPQAPSDAHGSRTAGYIKALRDGLIEMYKATPEH